MSAFVTNKSINIPSFIHTLAYADIIRCSVTALQESYWCDFERFVKVHAYL